MSRKFSLICLAFACLLLWGISNEAQSQEKRKGTISGEIKTKKDTPNKKNVVIEVLAAGEEKARPYRVQYDPKVKGPIPEILKAVKASNVGDRVQLEWIDTGEGLAITKFEVLKKKSGKKEKK